MDWLVQLFVAMFTALAQVLFAARDNTIQFLTNLVKAVLAQGAEWIIGLLDYFGVLDAIGFEGGSSAAIVAWTDFVAGLEPVAWFLPIYPALGIVAATYAIQGTIRAARWIFALIPTLGG